MSISVLRAVSLIAAITSMGLAAGTFAIYAHTIMPGLRKTDDRTFAGAFQSIDQAIKVCQIWRHGPPDDNNF
jgi:uncharacterized membrane protein